MSGAFGELAFGTGGFGDSSSINVTPPPISPPDYFLTGPAPANLQTYLKRVTSEHANQPYFVAYLRVLIQPLLDAQAFFRFLLEIYDLDTSVAPQLDSVGQWIGRSRYLEQPLAGVYFSFDTTGLGFDQGSWYAPFDAIEGLTTLDDPSYRQLLYAKRILNSWDGSIPVAASALSEMFSSPNTGVMIFDNQDMTQTVAIGGAIPPAVFINLLEGDYVPITPAGVQTNYLITSVDGLPLFGFDIDPPTTISGFDSGAFAGVPGVGPGQVTGIATSSITPTSVLLSWLAPTSGTGPYSYQVQMQIGNGTSGTWQLYGLPVSTTSETISGLNGSTQYAFQVYAINSSGPGIVSATITVTTLPATNVNMSGVSVIPSITAISTAVFAAISASSRNTIVPLSAVGRITSPLTAIGTVAIPIITAIGNVANAVIAKVTIPSLESVIIAGQVGINFAAAAVSIPPIIPVSSVTSYTNVSGSATIPSVTAVSRVTLGTLASGSANISILTTIASLTLSTGDAITITAINGANSGSGFTVSGTMSGYTSVPTLYYIDDAALPAITGITSTPSTTSIALSWNADTDPPFNSMPTGSKVTITQFSFTHPAIAAGTHTLTITDGTTTAITTYTSINPVGTGVPPAPTALNAISETNTSITVGFTS